MNPKNCKYTKEHEWVRLEGDIAIVGITDYAQEQLGDMVYVELPEVGTSVVQFEPCGVIESVKAASDLFSPLSGEVTTINEELPDKPELVNEDPYSKGWMIEVKPSDLAELDNLLTAKDYEDFLKTL